MKKLMIAAAVACAACFANATSVAWGVYEGYAMGTENYANGYALYLFDAGDGVSSSQLSSQLAKGDFTGLGGKLDVGALDDEGYYMNNNAATKQSYTAGNTTTMFAVIFNDGDINNATHFFIAERELTASEAGFQAYFPGPSMTDPMTAMQDSRNWTQVVPEPTSGLLLLLGVAGLALRRRRA